MQRRSFLAGAFALLFSAHTSQQAFALDLTLGLKASAELSATVGLDAATRNFINGLPTEVRTQVLKLLQDALPLVDESVEKYIAAINGVVDQQIDHLECAVIGTGQTLGADLKSSLPFGSPPEPVADLYKNKAKTIASFKKGTTPTEYEQAYSDLLYRAATTACQVNIVPEALVEVRTAQADIRPRWTAWHRVAGVCTDAKTCFDLVHRDTTALIQKSDPRDIAQVHAAEKLQAVKAPNIPMIAWNWDPSDVEVALNQMFTVEASVNVAREARLALAKLNFDAAGQAVTVSEAHIAAGQGSLSPSDPSANDRAIGEARAAVADAGKIEGYLNSAEELSSDLKERAAVVRTRLKKVRDSSDPIIASANTNKSAIAAAQAAAERQRQADLAQMRQMRQDRLPH